jgi:adenine-specific DNA-methyltransferase
MKAMMPRLEMMRSMLKPQGVIAICIDDNELFHLGMMMDEVFGEDNRLAILNWQKTTSKNDSAHVAKVTEYVLVYARDAELSTTGLLEPSAKAVARFGSLDNDPRRWKQGDLSAREHRALTSYGIQSPFTGAVHYPSDGRHWANTKQQVREWLEEWGVRYEECDLSDGRAPALVLRGHSPKLPEKKRAAIVTKAKAIVDARLKKGAWPRLYFGVDGQSRPMLKVYEEEVRSGSVPLTFWEEFEIEPYELGSVSWSSMQTGRSREGTEEFKSLVGSDVIFETIKPLKLFKKLIQLWCPANGLVLDPYAGSGTSGHAVLELNHEVGANRRFILIEQGRPEHGDKYARSLTWLRLKNAITGERPGGAGRTSQKAVPLGGGFEFRMLTSQIDAKTVLSMRRDELVDVVITSHWDSSSRNAPTLVRIEDPKFTYLVGRNEQGEGYFIIWNGDGPVGQLDLETYKQVVLEAKKADLGPPYHVYARYEVYQTRSVIFYKIPDRILAHLGLNESSDSYNDSEG